MTYIVDPKLIWLADMACQIDRSFEFIAVLSGLFAISALAMYIYNNYQCIYRLNNSDYKIYRKEAKKWAIVFLVIFIICLIGTTIVPEKYTIIEMVIAKAITTENINLSIDAIKDVTDYVVNAIKSLE